MASILNRKATKTYILRILEKNRPGWKCSRVSKQALEEIEAYLKVKIIDSIHRHPTKGKTFMNFD